MVGRKPCDPRACDKDILLEQRYRCKRTVGLEENANKLKNYHLNLQACRLHFFLIGKKERSGDNGS